MTRPISIVLDIYCTKVGSRTAYRIYVDNDLITERDWSWPRSKNYVRENIVANLAAGPHSIRIESVGNKSKFEIRNPIVDGKSVSDYQNFIV